MEQTESLNANPMSNIPLTRTKILVPRLPVDLLTRQRLLDLFGDLLDYRLGIIVAPAGYGKTYLLIDLVHRFDLPVCWYALDGLDQEPQRFIAHFIASIAHRFPKFGERSVAALQNTTSSDLNVERMVRIVVNEAYEHIREHFLIVLDDYHLVNGSEIVNSFVNQFVQMMDENCHLILSSRKLLTLPDLPLIVARSQAAGLGFEELAFRAPEIQALVLQNYRLTLPASAAQELARETEGWITGLLLSAKTMWQGMSDRLRVARVSGVGLYDYLAQQVLDQQPPPVRDFLLRTSVLEEFDAQLCEMVLGSGEDWGRLIEAVLQGNLFVLPLEDGKTWLRYHHLFSDFLQTRLAEEQPQERERILRRLAEIRVARTEWEKAHEVYRHLGDLQAMADLIEEAGPPLIKGGRLALLSAWIDALPVELIDERPALLSLQGVAASMQGDVELGLSLQNRAVAAYRAAGAVPRLARALVRRAVDHRFLGSYSASLADADEVLAMAEESAQLQAIWAEAARSKGAVLQRMGLLSDARDWLERALAAYEALLDMHSVAMLHADVGLANMNEGRYDEALAHYRRALDYWCQTNNVMWQANLLNNLGVLSHRKGDYERAHRLLEEALALARHSGYTRMEAFVLCGIGDLYAGLEAVNAARNVYRKARRAGQRADERFIELYADLAEADLARSSGDLAQAQELLDSAWRIAEESDSRYEQSLWQLGAGRLALGRGDASQAVELLTEAARHFENGGQNTEGVQAHLTLAAAFHSLRDREAAARHLVHTFDLASDLESQHSLVLAGRAYPELLEAHRNGGAVARSVVGLRRQIGRFEHEVPRLRRRLRRQTSAVPFEPPRLTIRALGAMDVALSGNPVEDAEWRSRKNVRDLLFLLVAHPEGLTKEGVGEVLWPESTPSQLKLRFKNAVYRLRRALGHGVVLFEDGLYQFNRSQDYEYDVERFLETLARAGSAKEPAVLVKLLQEAIDLYTGPYLADADGVWVWPERERLRRMYVETLLRLADLRLAAGDYEAALGCCRRALDGDPSLEQAHRVAMRVHAAAGNRTEIIRQFERCRQALLEEADAPPSPQTETLYQALMR